MPVFRNHDKPEILITYKSELLGDLRVEQAGNKQLMGFFFFKITQVIAFEIIYLLSVSYLPPT